jgi:thiol:disulfide interchange protein DsbD
VLADVTAINPGSSFNVGVMFDIKPGWHIYWTNPGDSGTPTSVKFELPAGFVVSDVRYPVPVRFEQPADVVGYGYTGSVLLTAQVRAPRDLPKDAPVRIGATARWLCCRDVCIPGNAKVDLTLPVAADDAGRTNPELFDQWLARVPVDAPAADALAEMKWSDDAKPADDYREVTLAVHWRQPVKDVELFPAADPSLDVRGAEVRTDGDHTTVSLKARVLEGKRLEIQTLSAVLAYTDADGNRHGVRTEVPIKALADASGPAASR